MFVVRPVVGGGGGVDWIFPVLVGGFWCKLGQNGAVWVVVFDGGFPDSVLECSRAGGLVPVVVGGLVSVLGQRKVGGTVPVVDGMSGSAEVAELIGWSSGLYGGLRVLIKMFLGQGRGIAYGGPVTLEAVENLPLLLSPGWGAKVRPVWLWSGVIVEGWWRECWLLYVG